MKDSERYPLRLDRETRKKIEIIAEKNSRSINKQIEHILKKFITDYEKVNEKIEIPEED